MEPFFVPTRGSPSYTGSEYAWQSVLLLDAGESPAKTQGGANKLGRRTIAQRQSPNPQSRRWPITLERAHRIVIGTKISATLFPANKGNTRAIVADVTKSDTRGRLM